MSTFVVLSLLFLEALMRSLMGTTKVSYSESMALYMLDIAMGGQHGMHGGCMSQSEVVEPRLPEVRRRLTRRHPDVKTSERSKITTSGTVIVPLAPALLVPSLLIP